MVACATGGVTYSIVCKVLPAETVARLLHAAQLGKTIRIVLAEAQVVLEAVTIEPLASGAVRVAGNVIRPLVSPE